MRAVIRLALISTCAAMVAASAAAQPAVTTVTMKGPDGVKLVGSYYPAAKPGPGLLLLHQCNRDRTAWSKFAAAAAARGYHVLTFDYRGYGESEGEQFEDFARQAPIQREKWPGDVDAAFAFLISAAGVDKNRIGAAGASCGVNQAAQLARRHPEVRTLVLLSGGIEPDAREYIRNTSSMPVMSAGSLDDGNLVQTMRWITGWSRHPASRFVEYKAAGHGTDMFAVEAGLQPAMLDWFDAHLKAVSTTPPAPAGTAGAKTVLDEFWSALEAPNGVAKARVIYDETRKKDKSILLFPESELNLFGYQILQAGRAKDAIVIFQMNVDEYPASANTYDSLSDAYLEDGNTTEALRFAEKALQALAKDKTTPEDFKQRIRESAEAKVAKLKK
jgi:pimeloyl-ACP methyl ester carboxylesterase